VQDLCLLQAVDPVWWQRQNQRLFSPIFALIIPGKCIVEKSRRAPDWFLVFKDRIDEWPEIFLAECPYLVPFFAVLRPVPSFFSREVIVVPFVVSLTFGGPVLLLFMVGGSGLLFMVGGSGLLSLISFMVGGSGLLSLILFMKEAIITGMAMT
jgi:hypothetical protein